MYELYDNRENNLKGLVLVLLCCALLSGCANPRQPVIQEPVDAGYLLSGEALLGREVTSAELPADPVLQLSPEMRGFLDTISPDASPHTRLNRLLRTWGRGRFNMQYDASQTFPASETFDSRVGNCMSFANMMVALSRELGTNAYYNFVEVPPTWGQDDRSFVTYQHINVVVEQPHGRRVMDFNLAAYDATYPQWRLTDREAFAYYYSNRGVEAMNRGQPELAFLNMRKALDLNPGNSYFWVNLGGLYSRSGKQGPAEQSYRQALLIRPDNLLAMSNLERLYRAQGRFAEADAYAQMVVFHRQRNPFYLYHLAEQAFEAGDYRTARSNLQRALRKIPEDHRLHFLRGKVNHQLGRYDQAREDFRTAVTLADTDESKQIYMQRLAEFGEQMRAEVAEQ
ncbi:hypothetical protein MNKW57_15440 [Biformimicrobium ophioploci]|uniref:Tetratricopeptide repeat protein n=1 Tax=Biformimicrobium ophioploci TaxID=3036711 RepID=A0ABQ6LYQ8_9GAMM|nr:hypothetical protein MNKW57_15440 [Microbulbifer sp. NKW57]